MLLQRAAPYSYASGSIRVAAGFRARLLFAKIRTRRKVTLRGSMPVTDDPNGAAPAVPGDLLFRLCGAAITFAAASLVTALVSGVAIVVAGLTAPQFSERASLQWGLGAIAAAIGWTVTILRPLSVRGQTLGMQVFGLRLTTNGGERPRTIRLFIREFLQWNALGIVVTVLGLPWALADPAARTVADRLTGTRVLRTRARFHAINEFREFRTSGTR